MSAVERSTVALIPAAGAGSRLGKLPFSKELLPLRKTGESPLQSSIPVAIENAVGVLIDGDITCQHIIIASGKTDIPEYLGDGRRFGATISYHLADRSPGVPYSLDVAYPFVESCDVVLIFPDIVFRPPSAVRDLKQHRSSAETGVTLALVPTTRGDKVDVVSIDAAGLVKSIRAKPGAHVRGWTWIAAGWSPPFSEFMHRFLAATTPVPEDNSLPELYVADVLNAAIDSGISVDAICFENGDAIDLGTPEDLELFWRRET